MKLELNIKEIVNAQAILAAIHNKMVDEAEAGLAEEDRAANHIGRRALITSQRILLIFAESELDGKAAQ